LPRVLVLGGFFAAALMTGSSARAADADAVMTLAVSVAAATLDGERVVDDAWIDGQWAAVDRLYAGIGIRFERKWTAALPESSARLETREDRDALGVHVSDGAIHVFFVKSLLDIDEMGRIRMGVCWRAPGRRRFVAVASNAKPTVLAHELGHYLGNGHSKVTDNVMSYDRTGGPVFFDATQRKIMRTTALQLLQDGLVRPAEP
jgi:hypothetical protein